MLIKHRQDHTEIKPTVGTAGGVNSSIQKWNCCRCAAQFRSRQEVMKQFHYFCFANGDSSPSTVAEKYKSFVAFHVLVELSAILAAFIISVYIVLVFFLPFILVTTSDLLTQRIPTGNSWSFTKRAESFCHMFSRWGNITLSNFFLLCTSLPLRATPNPSRSREVRRRRWFGPVWDTGGGHYASRTQRLRAARSPSALWQYDERNTFPLIMSPAPPASFLWSVSPRKEKHPRHP